jgi:hypothetical protein
MSNPLWVNQCLIFGEMPIELEVKPAAHASEDTLGS